MADFVGTGDFGPVHKDVDGKQTEDKAASLLKARCAYRAVNRSESNIVVLLTKEQSTFVVAFWLFRWGMKSLSKQKGQLEPTSGWPGKSG